MSHNSLINWLHLKELLSALALIVGSIVFPAAFTSKPLFMVTIATVGAIAGILITTRFSSGWKWLLGIFVWYIIITATMTPFIQQLGSSRIDELAVLTILAPPGFASIAWGYYQRSRHTNNPISDHYVQWSDGVDTHDHIDDPTVEQILAEFDKLDGSARSVLQVQLGLKRVEICVVNDDLTVFYHTDDHKRKDPWHAVYPPGQTEEGEYYGPFGGYEEIESPLYIFISKADNRRALEEFLSTGERPQSLLWLDCETESDLPLPPWG